MAYWDTDIFEGIFIKRLNRFCGEVFINGQREKAYIPNTGRLEGVLYEGANVFLEKVSWGHRKYAYTLIMTSVDGVLVSVSSQVPNKLFYLAFMQGLLDNFGRYTEIKSEVSFENSRFDFLLRSPEDMKFIEVKGVTLVKNGIAYFPDAPTERGKKHIKELIKAKEYGFSGAIVFIVQREDAKIFTPNNDMDPEFGVLLKEANLKGIELYAYNCTVDLKSIKLYKEIQVNL